MADLHLPDVSEFQPDVDWATVAAHNGGVAIIRALYGGERVDRLWAEGRRQSARAHKIHPLGIYQYLRKDEDALAQAEAFVKLVGQLEVGEFAVLDLEEGAGDQSPRAKAWFDHVDAHLTYPGYNGAWLYSDEAMLNAGLNEFLTKSHRPIWVAAYQPLSRPPGVSRYTLWQYTDGSQSFPGGSDPFPGVGKCDQSVFHGTVDDLRKVVHG